MFGLSDREDRHIQPLKLHLVGHWMDRQLFHDAIDQRLVEKATNNRNVWSLNEMGVKDSMEDSMWSWMRQNGKLAWTVWWIDDLTDQTELWRMVIHVLIRGNSNQCNIMYNERHREETRAIHIENRSMEEHEGRNLQDDNMIFIWYCSWWWLECGCSSYMC